MVTHELDIAHYCKRNLIVRDGLIVRDELVADRLRSEDELAKLNQAEVRAKLSHA
jgi:putative ABC transport system ATP-binding protein